MLCRSQCCVAKCAQVEMKGAFLTRGGLWHKEQTSLRFDCRGEARELSIGAAATQAPPDKRVYLNKLTATERTELKIVA